jgi:hypothetical protein
MLFQQLVNRLCSHCLYPACWQVVNGLLATCCRVVVLDRLVTSCSNNLLSSYNSTICQQVVSGDLVATWRNNSIVTTCWQARYKPVVNTSCWQVGRFLRLYTRKNAQVIYKSANTLPRICSQAVDKLFSHCLFPVVVTNLEQAVNNL